MTGMVQIKSIRAAKNNSLSLDVSTEMAPELLTIRKSFFDEAEEVKCKANRRQGHGVIDAALGP